MPFVTNGAQRASRHLSTPLAASVPVRKRAYPAVLAVLLAIALVPAQAPAAVEASHTEASRVVADAKSHIGASWAYGATGPYSFDCSGFVYHVFKHTGLLTRIGGTRMSARGYYDWFRARGKTSTTLRRVGDLVVYGYSGQPVSHIGIYIGNGYVISTLTSGVKMHGVYAVNKPFRAYLNVYLTR